ncbi:glycoside hydrolase family 97 catalytic domain-containing protein [Formosa sp. 4Alg 33]|uniref:glycoside hydrolase family 97 protein n=1 Tax=Formosa sp. 4Alg 33 TaxID=3382189 RepID=UPI003D9C4B0C
MDKKIGFKLDFTRCLSIIFLCVFIHSKASTNKGFEIESPSGKLSVVIHQDNNHLKYSLLKEGKAIVKASQISIFSNISELEIKGSRITSENSTWNPVWGQFSEIKNQYNELVLDLKSDGIKTTLFIRAYNYGVGFRYKIEGYNEGREVEFYCEYNLNATAVLYCPAGEGEPIGPLNFNTLSKAKELPKLITPIVVENSEDTYLSILESDLFTAPEFGVIKFNFNKNNKTLVSSNTTRLKGALTTTPWRVILVNDKIGDLVTNTVPLNLATPNQIEDTSWIKPGKTLWDWRVHDYKTKDGFTYGINTESYLRFIDFASEKGIEYFLIDDFWFTKATKGYLEIAEDLDIEKVSAYAKDKNVKLILYYDRHKGNFGDDTLFSYYQSLGMSGIKYGFMGSNVSFTSNAIQKSAESRLLIDFHDAPVPFTGIQRTYPNAITREYCHAQQDSRRAFTPETFIKMALVNAIQGPLDMNNGNFDLTGINSGLREKGPRKPNSYFSTVVSEVARTLIIYSGLVCIPDAPEAYNEKADLFEFIQKMPVGEWDESKVLHAKMGGYISTARKHGEEWFIGSVYNQEGGVLDLNLDFLKENQTYDVTFYEDTNNTHCKTNPEAYQIRKGKVKKGEVVKAKLAPGGGHAMWIRPIAD